MACDFPRVTGRVLDAVTGQPLADARVRPWRRAWGDPAAEKGATRLLPKQMVLTDCEGRFVLQGEKSFYLLIDHGGSYHARILIERSGYRPLHTNLLATLSVLGPNKGSHEIQAGEVFLTPVVP